MEQAPHTTLEAAVSQAVREGKIEDRREEKRMRKRHKTVDFEGPRGKQTGIEQFFYF